MYHQYYENKNLKGACVAISMQLQGQDIWQITRKEAVLTQQLPDNFQGQGSVLNKENISIGNLPILLYRFMFDRRFSFVTGTVYH